MQYQIKDDHNFTMNLELQVPFFANKEQPHLNLRENIHARKLAIMADFSSNVDTEYTDIAMDHHND